METVVKEGLMHGVESISTMQAISISLSGLATVFAALVALAIAIKLLVYVLEAMGLGNKAQKPEVKKAAASVSQSSAAAPAVEEDTEEYAAIIAAVSEYSRTPVERLKIKSITRIK